MEKNKTPISKPTLHITLKVLHNLWLNGHLDVFVIDEILRADYSCIIQYLEIDFMLVESLDGLTTNSLGDGSKYRKV